MAALKREVDKVTRQARIDQQAIIGQHMNQEFDRALMEISDALAKKSQQNTEVVADDQ